MCLNSTAAAGILAAAKTALESLFVAVGMPESHGLGHSLTVLHHMDRAVAAAGPATQHLLSPHRVLALQLAALLHEADDHKYFKGKSLFLL